MAKFFFSISFILYIYSPSLSGQQFLNGSFEKHDLECGINLPNGQFNLHVQDIFAFGGQSEIDLLTDSCGFDYAVDGRYFVALYSRNFSDEMSMSLTKPLFPSKQYKINFFSRLGQDIFNESSSVRIGLSNDEGDFGEKIFTTPILDTIWQEYSIQFEPDFITNYITIGLFSGDETWVFLDDFTLNCPDINLGNDTILCYADNFLLQIEEGFESYLWSDASTSTELIVHEAGTYWIEVVDSTCILQDTITIAEYDYQCQCTVVVPNAFSPNGDGINDVFEPVSACDILDYQLQIFNRWGERVFQSFDPKESWNGLLVGETIDIGTYTYVIQHRFVHQEFEQLKTGYFVLLE
ncbi:MAG: gliding motility-associated C-terminal domain-containing protein [Chitinophagales bacterium]